MAENNVTLLGVGDVGPFHEPVGPYSVLARPTLAAADIRFAQAERVYSELGALQIHAPGSHARLKPHMASVLSDCGFDVVSVASNHAMDWGPDALLDSIALLQSKGIKTIGGGRNLHEARQPAIIERNGVRIAFLGYGSILQDGYEAGPKKPGVAPLRADTYYKRVDYQAGAAPRIVTVPVAEDLEAMEHDIAEAKKIANVVILSIHWGIHYTPKVMADYQPVVAKAAFDAGVDLILGHHAHVPKAIAVHSGKVCFYSLSNFIMSRPEKTPAQGIVFARRHGIPLDPDYPRLPYGLDSKRSLIAKALISRDGVKKVSFLPVLIDKQLRPEVLRSVDPRFSDMVSYMDEVSEGFNHEFTVEGDEVVITGG